MAEKMKVEKLSKDQLDSLGVGSWSPWSCEPSVFDWSYDAKETCYILGGKAKVKSADQEIEFTKGDLVTFPKGLKCKWQILERINKVYKFG